MYQQIIQFSVLSIALCLSVPGSVPADKVDVATVQISQTIQSGADEILPGAYTVRVKESGEGKKIQLVRGSEVISDEVAIEMPLKKNVDKPRVVLEKMRSDNLLRIKITMKSSILMAYYKIK
jgi:hypothetical protein